MTAQAAAVALEAPSVVGSYDVTQVVRYDYPSPATHLRQRLLLVPPRTHGDQQLESWALEVSLPARRRDRCDGFGNLCVELELDRVEAAVEFRASMVVSRTGGPRFAGTLPVGLLRQATALTKPDAESTEAARALAAAGPGGLALAERICAWTSQRLLYGHGATGTTTTASEALAGGVGVCQDFAHIMVTVCRSAGLPAAYVSGHLLGEGPSHAWVEVVTPDRSGRSLLTAFDPTHARVAGDGYVTVAVGRDYADVAPTSGTCWADQPGQLSGSKVAHARPVRAGA